MTIPSSPADIRALIPDSYRAQHEMRSYNIRPSVLTAVSARDAGTLLMLHAAPGLTKDQHKEREQHFKTLAEELKREWAVEVDAAANETFGRPLEFHEYRISGIACDEFSEERKERLRALAHTRSACVDAERAHHSAAGRIRERKASYSM